MNTLIKLTKEKREDLLTEIKTYFATERNEDLGDLAATFILDFFTEKLAPEFYNQGVYDAHKYFTTKVEDLLELIK